MSKFTEGPWAVYNDNEGMPREYGPLWCVANEAYHGPSDDEAPCFQATIYHGNSHDAHLIAAAPELCEALEAALKTAESEKHPFRAWHQDARAALAKARGEA